MNPFSSVEEAYAHVQREDVRQTMMISSAELSPGALMASKGIKTGHLNSIKNGVPVFEWCNGESIL